jgi:DNA replication protein DnaC
LAVAGALRQTILDDFSALRIPISGETLDGALRQAEGAGLLHLEFLRRVISEQARGRRERAIERRIRQAYFGEIKTLEEFNWEFNSLFIDRVQVEALATGEFVARRDNLVMLGRSGIGKTHIAKAVGHRLCALGYKIRYATSAELLRKLTASLADQTLPRQIRYWSGFDLLMKIPPEAESYRARRARRIDGPVSAERDAEKPSKKPPTKRSAKTRPNQTSSD